MIRKAANRCCLLFVGFPMIIAQTKLKGMLHLSRVSCQMYLVIISVYNQINFTTAIDTQIHWNQTSVIIKTQICRCSISKTLYHSLELFAIFSSKCQQAHVCQVLSEPIKWSRFVLSDFISKLMVRAFFRPRLPLPGHTRMRWHSDRNKCINVHPK